MNNQEKIEKEIRKDLLGNTKKQEETIHKLLPVFNRFVKDNVKRGDFENYKKIQKDEYNREVKSVEYIENLSELFLDPILPLDLDDPEKFKPVIKKLARLYMENFM